MVLGALFAGAGPVEGEGAVAAGVEVGKAAAEPGVGKAVVVAG
jgi:hypothetical protein